MSFVLEDIIEDIYEAYEALPGGRDPLPRDEHGKPICGNKEKARNASFRVIWMLQGGTFDTNKLIPIQPKEGDPDGPNYAALCSYWVWIWQDTNEACWKVMVDLLAAARATIYGPRLGALNFTVPTEIDGHELTLGALFVLNITLAVPIPIEGSVATDTATIAGFETAVKLRNDLNGLETDPVPEPDIELVIVTNP